MYISDYLQKNASPQDLENHIDIADWLIRWKQAPDTMTLPADTPIQPIQQARLELVLNELRHYWSEETVQAAAPLIEDLDLEIKSVTYIKPEDEDIPLKESVRRANRISCQIDHPYPIPPPRHRTMSGPFVFLESVFMTTVRQSTLAISFCCAFLYGFTQKVLNLRIAINSN